MNIFKHTTTTRTYNQKRCNIFKVLSLVRKKTALFIAYLHNCIRYLYVPSWWLLLLCKLIANAVNELVPLVAKFLGRNSVTLTNY